MGIYIKGMEMPTEGGTICVYKISGKFFAARAGKDELFPIVPVPPHGRLIDADALERNLLPMQGAQTNNLVARGIRKARGILRYMRTVIPASEEG